MSERLYVYECKKNVIYSVSVHFHCTKYNDIILNLQKKNTADDFYYYEYTFIVFSRIKKKDML